MNDPERWLTDSETDPELSELLRNAPRARELDHATRARIGARVTRYAAIPVSVATWLSVKSAAAIGLAAGLVSAGASVAIIEYSAEPAAAPTAASAASAFRWPAQLPASPHASAATALSSETPSASAAPALPPVEIVAARPSESPSASSAGGLAEESLLLERARRALADSPAHSLALLREHRTRFPRASLVSERQLIELEAFYRLGQKREARALGERLLKAGGDDLYIGRIRRLLAKIDGGE